MGLYFEPRLEIKRDRYGYGWSAPTFNNQDSHKCIATRTNIKSRSSHWDAWAIVVKSLNCLSGFAISSEHSLSRNTRSPVHPPIPPSLHLFIHPSPVMYPSGSVRPREPPRLNPAPASNRPPPSNKSSTKETRCETIHFPHPNSSQHQIQSSLMPYLEGPPLLVAQGGAIALRRGTETTTNIGANL